jgi:hypothetical protein
LDPFGGFDYDKRGAALIQSVGPAPTPATPAGSTFDYTFSYMATAVTIVDTSSAPFAGSNLNTAYEVSVFATLNETLTCLTAGCSVVIGNITGGNYNVYYDPSRDANYAAGTGFTNGTVIISGNVLGGLTLFSGGAPAAAGGGNANLIGSVTTTNPAFFNQPLTGTVAASTLQLGAFTTDFTRPADFNGMGNCGGTDTASCFIVQADGNQSFTSTAIPEPASLALFGLGILALGVFNRLRNPS